MTGFSVLIISRLDSQSKFQMFTLFSGVVAVVRTRPRAMSLPMINMRKSTPGFPFLYEYGDPLGGPSGRRSSAINIRYHSASNNNVEILAKKGSCQTFYHSLYVYVSSVFFIHRSLKTILSIETFSRQ